MDDLPHFKGQYNRYNVRAAVMVLGLLYNMQPAKVHVLLQDAYPAFGRQETVVYNGKKWLVMLAKNPAGFNQSIDALGDLLNMQKTTVIIVLNDRIPDGTDVSWIWDVEFEKLYEHVENLVITGDRAYDMAIRMETAAATTQFDMTNCKVEADLHKAIMYAETMNATLPIVVLATYTGMLEARKILTGRALL